MTRFLALFAVSLLWTVAPIRTANARHVLFIAVDDLKPTLGCYNDPIAQTPSMDRLAARGTVFTNAHCQWPVCGPSRASVMTSLRPEATGVMDLKTDMRAKNPSVLTLPEHFKNNGYLTAGVGKIYDPRCVDSKQTLDKPSWSWLFEMPSHRIQKRSHSKDVTGNLDVADNDLTDGAIADLGIRLMQRLANEDQPFFLAVGFKKPHLPFVAPQRYWNIYDRAAFPLATHQGGIAHASGYSLHNCNEFRGYDGVPQAGPIPEALQYRCLHGYYACVSYVDAQIGRLLDELDRLELSDSTTIVLWGDHGFHLGDHGLWGKHTTLENAARVPLIICPAGGLKSRRSNTPVELIDIFPTLCDLADLDTPTELSGRSLTLVLNGSRDAARNNAVRDGAVTVFKSKGALGYSYRTTQHRYTEWIDKQGRVAARELYDYDVDPLEQTNVVNAPRHAALCDRLAEQLRRDAPDAIRLHKSPPQSIR